MSQVAAVLFLVAAGVGAAMAAQRLRGVEIPPTGMAVAHGGLAALALVLYLVALLRAASPPAAGWWAAGLFVLAALGGSALFLGFHLRRRPLPVGVVLAHGGIAVVAFLVLLVALFGTGGAGAGPVDGTGGY